MSTIIPIKRYILLFRADMEGEMKAPKEIPKQETCKAYLY